MTTDGVVYTLTTLFFENVASEICNVSLSSVSVSGSYQPQVDNEVPGWQQHRELSRAIGAVIIFHGETTALSTAPQSFT